MVTTDKGWAWIINAACFFNMLCVLGLFRSSGVLYTAIINVFGTSREEAAWPFSISSTVGLLVAVFNGLLCQLFSIRTVVFSATLMCALGSALCFIANGVLSITIYFGVLYGMGIGMVTMSNLIIICQYFKKYRTIATGIVYAGSAVSSFVLPPVLEVLLEIYGLRGTFLITSGIILQGLIAASLYRPQETELNDEKHQFRTSDRSGMNFLKIVQSWVKIFQFRVFYLIWITYSAFHFTYFNFPTVIVDYASDLRISRNKAVFLLSSYSIADLCGRLACGWITDTGLVKRKYVVIASFFLLAVLLTVTPFFNSYIALMLISISIGFFTGCLMTQWSILFTEYLGLTHLPSAMGTVFTLAGFIPINYPAIIGYFRDVKGNYALLFYTCATLKLFAGILWCMESYIGHLRIVQ